MPAHRAPATRPAPPISLTQPNARSGRVCEVCGDERLTEIGMTLTDGTAVHFTSCHRCETKSWRRDADGGLLDLDFETVIGHTRKR